MNRYFVHVYRTVRSKFLIVAPDHAEAMRLADLALPDANERLEYDRFHFNDDERKAALLMESGEHIATDDADEITGYQIDEVGDDEFDNTVSYTGDGELMHDGPGKSHTFTPRQRDTILAALRLWQGVVEGIVYISSQGFSGQLLESLCDIANNDREAKDGVPPALSPNEIDELCERINC
jgi:hypothetical protein